MSRCPCCRQPLQPHHNADLIGELVDRMRRRCAESGAWVGVDDAVTEATAADLLGIAAGTLRNQRSEGRAPPHLRRARGVIRYRLIDLAGAMLESDA